MTNATASMRRFSQKDFLMAVSKTVQMPAEVANVLLQICPDRLSSFEGLLLLRKLGAKKDEIDRVAKELFRTPPETADLNAQAGT